MQAFRIKLSYYFHVILIVISWGISINALILTNNTENDLGKFKEFIEFFNVSKLGSDNPKPKYRDIMKYNTGLLNEDLYLDAPELIKKYGFPVETHRIHTSDGYILTIFRISCGGPPVFLMHGLILSADDFIIAGPESAIAYSLAYEGYDVWLGNARGNKYSRQHETLSPDKDSEFWDFSWNEIGLIDVPTMIDYVLNTTAQSQLLYAGHSQGTTSFFVMCSERPEYNKKIKVMIAMAAAAWISHLKSPVFRALALFDDEEYFISNTLGYPNEILPSNIFTKAVTALLCGTAGFAAIICSNLAFIFFGFDYAQLNITNLPNIYQHAPAGSSLKQFIHYFQGVNSGEFKKFDYGEKKNIEMYGSKSPPRYPVENIEAPVAIFYSDNDWLVSVTDANIVRYRLPNVIEFYRVPFKKFNHLDYLWGKDLRKLAYCKISKIFKKYSRSFLSNTISTCPKKEISCS